MSAREAAPVFAALGDETRLSLVALLSRNGPLTVKRLTASTRVTRQAVSKHLHVMEQAGLVRGRRAGRTRLWQLELPRLTEARRQIEEISDEWDQALLRLQKAVEDP